MKDEKDDVKEDGKDEEVVSTHVPQTQKATDPPLPPKDLPPGNE